jgi:choline dehydrogenase-like flavoprotein
MFVDLRSLDDSTVLETDICIVGAGPAGISMARTFIGTGMRVILVESGDLEFNGDIQALYAGESVGLPYFGLEGTRLRYFGGSSNHWDNWCGEFNPIDYRTRTWVPSSGWPFGPAELAPYYDRARPICGLRPRRSNEEMWASLGIDPLPFDGSRLEYHFWEVGNKIRFGEAYRADLREARNIQVLLNANATELRTDQAARTVEFVDLQSLEGRQVRVRARFFVLACGGIENARLMLDSNRVEPHGLGNRHDLVGRYFMEHPIDRVGSVTTDDPLRLIDLFRPGWLGEQSYFPSVVLSDGQAETEQILNNRFHLMFESDEKTTAALRRFGQTVTSGRVPDRLAEDLWELIQNADIMAYNLFRRTVLSRPIVPKPERVSRVFFNCQAEQAPNPDSRITLSNERNALGGRLPILDWRLTELDKRSFYVPAKLLGAELARLGIGLFRIEPWLLDGANTWSPNLVGGYHHMGTTRMAKDERQGVVDSTCKVHNVDNLYVAGSSVFPTSGNINPTLTLVALALRLADHLKQRIIERV